MGVKKFFSHDLTIAFMIAILAAILLAATAPAIGLTWDEPAYISSAESYVGWFGVLAHHPAQAFQPATIDKYWTPTHEHPPVDRIWSGLVWAIARNFTDDLTAHRLGNILLASVMVGMLYLFIAQGFGKTAGLFAAGALLTMPRFFFHAHLAALDVPVAVGIFLVTFFFWKVSGRKEWWWGILIGIAWGVVEGMKLNATFLPFALAAWALLFRRQWYMLLRFILMGITAPLVFVAVWPWLYHDTWTRIVAYFNFHDNHARIGAWYFGHYYVPPPWPYVFVITLAVVPLTVMALMIVGAIRSGKGRRDGGLGWLLFISMLVPLLVFATGKVLVYDDDRLFMPAFPFLAALAGVGFGWIVDRLRRFDLQAAQRKLFGAGIIALGVLLLLPQVLTGAVLFPHLLSYYSESVGGLYGAHRLGLETTYWCESYKAALPYINAHAQPGDRVWVEPCNLDVMTYYQMHGQLRSDVKLITVFTNYHSFFGNRAPRYNYGDFNTANWILLQSHESQYGYLGPEVPPVLVYVRKLGQPVYQVSFEGIPIMQLYETRRVTSQ